jgi:hypothetical protein
MDSTNESSNVHETKQEEKKNDESVAAAEAPRDVKPSGMCPIMQ